MIALEETLDISSLGALVRPLNAEKCRQGILISAPPLHPGGEVCLLDVHVVCD